MSSTPTPPGRAALPAPENGIPPLIYLARVLWLCFFPVFTVLVGDFVLIFVAQAREALVAFNDEHVHSQLFWFAFAYALWMVSAWYVARLLLGKQFKPNLLGECSSPLFARDLAIKLPRVLAIVAGLPVPVVLLYRIVLYGQSGLWLVVLSLLVSCVIVLALIAVWRSWQALRNANLRWTELKWTGRGSEEFVPFESLSRAKWLFIWFLFFVSFGVWVAIPLGLEHVARLREHRRSCSSP